VRCLPSPHHVLGEMPQPARREIGARALAAFFSAPLPRASLVRWRSERRSLLCIDRSVG
jgi:hypothetical protein